MYWFMCNKINGIPSIEVSDKDKLKKKKIEKFSIDIKKLPGYCDCDKRRDLIN